MQSRIVCSSARPRCGIALLVTLTFLMAPELVAQNNSGRIVGRVVDASTGTGLSDVGVQIVGTTTGTVSGVDGRYALGSVRAGTVTLHVRRIGFQPKTVTGILLDAGRTVEQHIALEPSAVVLAAQIVTAEAERGTVSEALNRQRNATGIVNAITSQEIARSPDGDAAAAVKRVSGVTVQEGRYVFVRGLGDRYTTTSLNGARIPSPEPERKVVPLDIFPAGLLQSITASKTFTPDLPGDFSGAIVDIRTREFPAQRLLTYSVSAGYNTAATGNEVLAAPTVGREWLAFGGDARQLPEAIARAGDFSGVNSQGEYNAIVSSFRNAWTPIVVAGSPNYSMSVALGGEDPVAGQRIGYVASATYSWNQEVRLDEQRATAIAGSTPGEVRPYNPFAGSTGRTSVLWGGVLNLSTWIAGNTRLSLDNTYSRGADNEAHSDEGFFEDLSLDFRRQSLRYVERTVRSNRLAGEHALGANHALEWSVASSGVSRDEPDRADLVYAREPGSGEQFAWLSFRPEAAKRTFSSLNESSLAGEVSYRLSFDAPGIGHDGEGAIEIGSAYRDTRRDAANRSYDILSRDLSLEQRQQSAEVIFGDRFVGPSDSVFTVGATTAGGSYAATEGVLAGYGMVEYPIASRVHVIAGARVERWDVEVFSEPTLGDPVTSTRLETDVLPAAAVKLALTEWQNIRISASRTLSRPDYREISPIPYRDLVGERELFGNPNLQRSLIQNYDMRWEWYPAPAEIVSVGVFTKYFDEPIERIEVGSTGRNQLSFANADAARNYGIELELRKGLAMFGDWLEPVSAFANVTLMHSVIETGDDSLSALSNASRAMVGQAPYVVNGGLSWAPAGGRMSATVLYNVVGKRISAAGTRPLPDVYEQERQLLDVSVRFPLFGDVNGRFDARNLLDAPILLTQGPVVRERYRTGRVFSAGLSWRPR
ncbi:MAG: TonB-dependent receptor domain-containing protein [Gemmatimonadaceae bacterium]